MKTVLPDEYQDGRTAGSLVRARRCWLDLMDAGTLQLAQRFTFAFHCPTVRMAFGLTDFLRYADYTGFVRATEALGLVTEPAWQVAGTTRATVWSLASLEHLFMDLRRAGTCYDSMLATLDLLPMTDRAVLGGRVPAGPRTEGP